MVSGGGIGFQLASLVVAVILKDALRGRVVGLTVGRNASVFVLDVRMFEMLPWPGGSFL